MKNPLLLMMMALPLLSCAQDPQLILSVQPPKTEVAPGQKAVFTVSAKNVSRNAVSFQTGSGLKLDLDMVRDDNGKLAWKWSQGRMFTLAIQTVNLQPGEALTQELEWSGKDAEGKPIPAGDYWLYPTLSQMQEDKVLVQQRPIRVKVGPMTQTQGEFHIRGRVENLVREVPINGGPRQSYALIVSTDPKSSVQQARIRIDDKTTLPPDGIKTGQIVDVLFDGPVTRSIPAQAHAAKVTLVHEEPYDILGRIESIDPSGNSMLVVALPHTGSKVDRAMVRLNAQTVRDGKDFKVGD